MDSKKPYLVAILIQTIYAGYYLLSKVALDSGMSNFIFVFYRQAFATLFLVPIAIIVNRKGAPHLSFTVFMKMFLLALFGVTGSLNVYAVGLRYTTSTLAASTTNTLPAITFFLAVLLRMEVVNMSSLSGNAKIAGIVVCLLGAVTIAFYKGPHLKSVNHHHLFSHGGSNTDQAHASSSTTWIIGSFLLLTSTTSWCFWLVFQGRVLKSYPSKFLFTTMQCLLSTIQSFFVALAFEPKLARWKLSLDVGLLAVAYCGVIVTGLTFYLQAWCIEKRGPVFSAMFTPLALVITLVCSAFLLGETIDLGSLLGGILMVGGLYSVLWGKSRELKEKPADEGNDEIIEVKATP